MNAADAVNDGTTCAFPAADTLTAKPLQEGGSRRWPSRAQQVVAVNESAIHSFNRRQQHR